MPSAWLPPSYYEQSIAKVRRYDDSISFGESGTAHPLKEFDANRVHWRPIMECVLWVSCPETNTPIGILLFLESSEKACTSE